MFSPRTMKMAVSLGILIFCYSLQLRAQENVIQPKSATYARQGDFRINYADGTVGFPCTLKGIFFREEGTYQLWMLGTNSDGPKEGRLLLTLSNPLNYAFFHSAFTKAIGAAIGSDQRIEDNSVQAVYNMLYTLNMEDQDDNVLSGNLWLKCWVIRFDSKFASEENKRLAKGENVMEREQIADRVGNEYRGYHDYVLNLRNSIDSQLSRGLRTYTAKFDKQIQDTVKSFMKIGTALANSKSAKQQRDEASDKATTVNSIIAQLEREIKSSQKAIDSFTRVNDSASHDTIEILQKYQRSLESDLTTYKGSKETSDEEYNNVESEVQKAVIEIASATNSHAETVGSLKTAVAAGKLEASTEESQYRFFMNAWRLGRLNRSAAFFKDLNELENKLQSATLRPLAERYFTEQSKFDTIRAQLQDLHLFKINRVSLQFERGYLERIQVWVDNGRGEDIFENIYAIGMSSISNYKRFSDLRLFIRKSSAYCSEYIYLSDVIGNYDNFLAGLTRDYSPADTSINNLSPCSTPNVILRKERLVNLFDARVYTDLAGLRADQPNGLVQLEASRRFNIYTHRIQAKRADYSFANYLNAYGALTKLEEDQRRLPLRNAGIIQNNRLVSPSYATNLDFRQYENFSLGAMLNLFLFDWPDAKFTLFVDAGLRYGHTSVLDSVRSINGAGQLIMDTNATPFNRDAHTFTWELPKLTIELFSEKRVGLTLSYQYNNTRLYSNNFYKQVVSYAKSDLSEIPLERLARFSHMFEMGLRVETSRNGNGRMFLRARYFKQRGDANTFFPQIQAGYAYNLIFRK